MHELSIAYALLCNIENALAPFAGSKRLVTIGVELGALSCVAPDALSYTFDLIAPGTVAEGANLQIQTRPLVCRCRTCAEGFESDNPFSPCPDCGSEDTCTDPDQDAILLASLEFLGENNP